MFDLYFIALLIHVICAIIFVGYLFFDVVIFSKAKKLLSQDESLKASEAIMKNGIKIMPFCVLALLITGLLMINKWVGFEIGFISLTYQKIFMIKLISAGIIFIAVAINLTHKLILKKPSPFKDIHPIALVLAIIIIFCAKLIHYV